MSDMLKPLLCIVHIPKTAGSAIRETLVASLGADKVYWVGHGRHQEEWESAKGNEFGSYWVVGGHESAPAFDKIERPKVFMAVLRDPVERTISLFNYIVEGRGIPHPLHEQFKKLTIPEAFEISPGFRRDVTNRQCDLIGGEATYNAALKSICGRRWFLGTFEKVDELFASVCKEFGWPIVRLKQDNVATKGYEARYESDRTSRWLAQINAEDSRLFEMFKFNPSSAAVSVLARAYNIAEKSTEILPPHPAPPNAPLTILRRGEIPEVVRDIPGVTLLAMFSRVPRSEVSFYVNRPVQENNRRVSASVAYIRELLVSYLLNPDYYHATSDQAWPSSKDLVCAFQLEDRPADLQGTIGYCSLGSKMTLIPDVQFWLSRGYFDQRQEFQRLAIPWSQRKSLVFWRGSTTGIPGITADSVSQLPRLQLCLVAKALPEICDIKLSAVVQTKGADEMQRVQEVLRKLGILSSGVPRSQFLGYRYQVDIDGNSNSFGFLAKLLMGSCILKVASKWHQWYYNDLRPWEHYVPVSADMSDFAEKVSWCLEHENDARQIGEAGKRYAEHVIFGPEMLKAASLIPQCCQTVSAPLI
jgi:hypothetical protein